MQIDFPNNDSLSMNITRILAITALVLCSAIATVAQTFNPSDYGTVSLHLKADTLGLANGAAVSNWSGLTVPTGVTNGANAPTFVTSDAGFNSKAVVQFAAASRQVLAGTNVNYAAQTIFAVASLDASAVSLAGMIGRGDDKLNIRRNAATAFYRSPGQAADVNDFCAVVAGGTLSVNNVASGSYTASAAHLVISTAASPQVYTNFWLGNPSPTLVRFWQGKIAEVLIYDGALTATQRNAVGYYLQTKYNLPTNFTQPVPTVVSFTGSAGGVTSATGILSPSPGTPVTLSWATQNAVTVSIDNGALAAPGTATGSVVVSPTATTTYTLTASGTPNATATFTVHIGVTPAAPSINEFLAQNDSGLLDPTDPLAHPDWIEIYNPNVYGIDLAGYRLKNNLAVWDFPTGSGIAANGYLVVFASGKNLANPAQSLHTNFTLDAEGEYLALIRISDLAVVTEFAPTYPNQYGDVSYGWWAPRNGFRYFGRPTGTPTPGAANGALGVLGFLDRGGDTNFSIKRGFYSAAITTTVNSTAPGATIVYTVNGSTPTLSNGTQVLPGSPSALASVDITVHPDAVPGGATGVNVASIGGVTMLRAALFKDDYAPTNVDTQTYVFAQQMLGQTEADATARGWPASTTNVNGQLFNYGMDPAAVGAYPPADITDALNSLPMISIVSDMTSWIDPVIGIYSNADLHGGAYERPMSVEMIHPPGYVSPDGNATGFQSNAGVRIRGGASRGDAFFKHALRLYFNGDYDGKLNYPLFGTEGTNKFSVVDLATSSNYAWYREAAFGTGSQNTMCRDMFSRDSQGAMGQSYARSRFYHVMLNGHYWGIYYTDERPVADFAASYHGGTDDDYDAVKCGNRGVTPTFSTEATDGDLVAWTNLWNKTRAIGTQNASDEKYFELLGRNPDGTRNLALPVLLDVDSLIDTLMVIFYSGDGDAVLSNFLSRNTPNNWFSYYKRNGESGFKFILHDAEHSLGAGSSTPDQTGPYGGSLINSLQFSNHQRIHQDLLSSAAYRRHFSDHVQKHFFNDGALTTAKNIARFNNRAAQVRKAMKIEEARWGDAKAITGLPGGHAARYTVADWETAVTNVTNWMSTRNATVLDQLTRDGLYSALTPPTMANDANGAPQHGGNVAPGFVLRLTASGGPTIYYTTDGSDPRPELAAAPTLTTFLTSTANGQWHVPTASTDGYTALANPVVAYAFYPLDFGTAPVATGSVPDTATADGVQNGTFIGAPTLSTNRNGTANTALTFSGSGQAITIGDPVPLQITGQITLAAWSRTTAAPTNAIRNIVAKGAGTSGEIFLRMNGGDWEVGTNNGTNHLASFPIYADLSTWVHVAGTYDGTAWRLYRNGQLVATRVDPVGPVSVTGGSSGWSIGANGAGTGRLWTGQLDDVAIFNTALTATQIAAVAGLNRADWAQPGATLAGVWTTSPGGIGYERDVPNTLDPAITTDIEASIYNIRTSLQLRKDVALTAGEIASVRNLVLRLRYDDGYVAYLNGVEVARKNAPALGVLNGFSAATAAHNDADALLWESVDITPFAGLLVPGNNVVAVQGMNLAVADEDFLINVELAATTTPYGIGGTAQIYSAPLTINSATTVKTRTYASGEWSALDAALFTVNTAPASAANIVVTQVAYNPIGGSTFEWIELMAIGAQNVDLTNVSISDAVAFTFPSGTILPSGGRVQVAGNIAAFTSRYGVAAPVNLMPTPFIGNLGNGGERIFISRLNGATTDVIQEFTYNFDASWPAAADGAGPVLVLIDPLSNPDHKLGFNWRASAASGGSPGVNDAYDYAAWAAANSITDPLGSADDDGDGLANLLEYFFGSNPAAFTAQPATALQTVTVTGVPAEYLTITFTRKIANDEVAFTVESTADLTTPWLPAIQVGNPIYNSIGTETYTYRYPTPRAASTQQYLRVKVAR